MNPIRSDEIYTKIDAISMYLHFYDIFLILIEIEFQL